MAGGGQEGGEGQSRGTKPRVSGYAGGSGNRREGHGERDRVTARLQGES